MRGNKLLPLFYPPLVFSLPLFVHVKQTPGHYWRPGFYLNSRFSLTDTSAGQSAELFHLLHLHTSSANQLINTETIIKALTKSTSNLIVNKFNLCLSCWVSLSFSLSLCPVSLHFVFFMGFRVGSCRMFSPPWWT